jgi:hypothetical protein
MAVFRFRAFFSPAAGIVSPCPDLRDVMKNLKTQIKIVIALGILSLLGGLLTHLALTGIYHGETDVTLEESLVRVCAVVFATFVGTSLLTLKRVLKVV